jgi:hypothetical protein
MTNLKAVKPPQLAAAPRRSGEHNPSCAAQGPEAFFEILKRAA